VDRGDHNHDRGFADRKVTLEDEELLVPRKGLWRRWQCYGPCPQGLSY
jgi:hypothetical protein